MHIQRCCIKKKWLESLLHPLVKASIQEKIKTLREQKTIPYCLVVIPLLFETNARENIDRILLIDCDPHLQIARGSSRDIVRHEQMMAIMQTQSDRETRIKLADDVIVNNGTKAALARQVCKLDEFYQELT